MTTGYAYSLAGQVLAEQDQVSGSGAYDYIYSPVYVNAMVTRDTFDGSGNLAGRLYARQDANWNVTSIVVGSKSGSTVTWTSNSSEFYTSTPYGVQTVVNSVTETKYDFQGGSYDLDTGLVLFNSSGTGREYDTIAGAWKQQDCAAYIEGPNRYQFADSIPTDRLDSEGLASFRIGTKPPPNPYKAEIEKYKALYKTWDQDSSLTNLWGMEEGALADANVIGGYLHGLPHAAAGLSHFLSNSGTPYDVGTGDFVHEDTAAKANFYSDLDSAMAFVESLLGKGMYRAISDIIQADNTAFRAGTPDWVNTVGQTSWYGQGTGLVITPSGCFSMTFTVHQRDYYKWVYTSPLTGGVGLKDGDLAVLHLLGVAQDYEQYGSFSVDVSWTKGQRSRSGASLTPKP